MFHLLTTPEVPVVPDQLNLTEAANLVVGAITTVTMAYLGLRRWWRSHISPVLSAILTEATAANKAVNNVADGVPTLSDRVDSLDARLSRIEATKEAQTETLNQILDAVTRPPRG